MFWAALAMMCFDGASVDPEELLVLESRRSIRCGEIQVESVEFRRQKGEDDLQAYRTIIYDLSFDGDKLHSVQAAGRVTEDGQLQSFAKETGLRSDGRVYHRNYNLADPTMRVAIPEASINDPSVWAESQVHVFDPRLFGLQPVPFGVLHSCAYEEFVGHPTRSSTAAEDAILQDTHVRVVTYAKNGVTYRLWISPSQGWNLLKSEIELPGVERKVLTCEIQRFGAVWYPSRAVFEQIDGHGAATHRNVARVLKATFNNPIPPERFTFAALEPLTGTIIFDAAKPERVIGRWDGEELIRLTGNDVEVPTSAASEWRDRLVFVFAFSAGLGMVLLALWYRSSRKSGDARRE